MFLIDRRYIRYFDWISFFIILIISAIGLAFVYSATYQPDVAYSIFFKKQLFGMISGIGIYLLFSYMHYQSLMRWGYFAYFFVLLLLVFTIIKGSIGMGAQRWISIGFFKLQPSELTKLFFPAFITYYLYTQREDFSYKWYDFSTIIAVMGLTFILVRKQPDLGTALIILFSGVILLWLAGLNNKFFITGFIFLIISAPISWTLLKDYQKKRILVFLGQGEKLKERYQIEQSKIAIGSGGLTGKGFLQGTQNQLQFLPESRTDFIFSVVAEELGLVGTITILLLYIILFLHQISLIKTFTSPFMQLLGFGLIIHIILSVIINICMVLGLLPVVGIPLPLLSYGLSNLWITFASLGWFNSIAMRRFYVIA
ncbi:MAG TPA: rod shape-determining protein RodA [Candidatus Babeliales bacterium]|nr:rod shape-determining protein RodA [Candidatus Babeliales bacterium]